jgi:hypothetical protein
LAQTATSLRQRLTVKAEYSELTEEHHKEGLLTVLVNSPSRPSTMDG